MQAGGRAPEVELLGDGDEVAQLTQFHGNAPDLVSKSIMPISRIGHDHSAGLPSRATMKSSLEIAQEAELRPIESIAERIGLDPDEIEPYGRYKGKIALSVIDRLAGRRTASSCASRA